MSFHLNGTFCFRLMFLLNYHDVGQARCHQSNFRELLAGRLAAGHEGTTPPAVPGQPDVFGVRGHRRNIRSARLRTPAGPRFILTANGGSAINPISGRYRAHNWPGASYTFLPTDVEPVTVPRDLYWVN